MKNIFFKKWHILALLLFGMFLFSCLIENPSTKTEDLDIGISVGDSINIDSVRVIVSVDDEILLDTVYTDTNVSTYLVIPITAKRDDDITVEYSVYSKNILIAQETKVLKEKSFNADGNSDIAVTFDSLALASLQEIIKPVDPDVDPVLINSGSLLAYYPFNGNLNDMSGNGHHGTSSVFAYAQGIDSLSLKLDGSTQVSLGDIDLDGDFTIEFWIQPETLEGKQIILQK
ncbi:MAG: hypothetical protein HQK83_08560 [Fibrobacteria bacterium]|nr:hypothetical protein [Fibrobacteria bacterium]